MRRAFVILSALSLAACARGRAPIVSVSGVHLPAMPASELICKDEPSTPKVRQGEPRVRESALELYVLDLRTAGADCRDKLGVVRKAWVATVTKQDEIDGQTHAIPPQEGK